MKDSLDTPATRLRLARIRAGYDSAEAFALKVKLKPVTYRSYENGTNGFSKYAVMLAKALGVTTEWLMDGGDVPDDADNKLQQVRAADELAEEFGIVMVREVDISYAMGDGSIVEDYPDIGMLPFQENFLKMLRVRDPSRVFVCKGDGDSMAPTIHSQDMVLIDTARQRVTLSDHIWAISVAGAGMIKRLRPLPTGQVMVLSDNPAIPEQTVDGEDLFVVGKVVWIGRMM